MLVFTYWYRMNKGKKVIPRSPFPSSGSAPAHLEAVGVQGSLLGCQHSAHFGASSFSCY